MGKGRTDCFAYNTGHDALIKPCTALNRRYCEEDGNCPFYKTGMQEVHELRTINGAWTVEEAVRDYERKARGQDPIFTPEEAVY